MPEFPGGNRVKPHTINYHLHKKSTTPFKFRLNNSFDSRDFSNLSLAIRRPLRETEVPEASSAKLAEALEYLHRQYISSFRPSACFERLVRSSSSFTSKTFDTALRTSSKSKLLFNLLRALCSLASSGFKTAGRRDRLTFARNTSSPRTCCSFTSLHNSSTPFLKPAST